MGFWMPGSGGDRSSRRVELRLSDQGGSGVLPLTFLGEIQNMRKSCALLADLCWDLGRVEEGEERQQVSLRMLTCILAWEPGLPEGQAKGEQQFTTGSGQAQEASP